MAPSRLPVLGVNISCTSYEQVVEACRHWIRERQAAIGKRSQSHYICVTSVHGIMAAQDDAEMRQILNGADIATPDGMPVVWALRSLGIREQERVYGPSLMLELCRDAAATGARIFLYGARMETLGMLEAKLRALFPTICIAGLYSPPFRPLTPQEDAAIVEQIVNARTDLLFVGLSTPKQEKWMYDHRDRLPGITTVGVGAAFDFHAGRTRQAPAWMQRIGLEWFFRLMLEPGRLWRRYLLITPRFLPLWALQRVRSRR